MDRDKMLSFYEKIYFYEMETRDKLYMRVQINFALIFTGYSIISYMLRMLDFSSHKDVSVIFAVLAVISILISVRGVWYLVPAFWGNEYKAVPSAKDIDNYKIELQNYAISIEHYNESYPENKQAPVNIEEMLSQFIYEQLRDCSSHNTVRNDSRFALIHNSVRWLLIASIPFLIASILFVTFDLDASSPRKEIPAEISSLTKKLEDVESNLAQAKLSNKTILEVQQICLLNQVEVLHLHQALLKHQSHEELLKTVNHQEKCEEKNDR